MKGVVFTEFLDFVEARCGLEVLDEVLLAAAPANAGAYTAVGTYDWREFAGLVAACAARSGGDPETLLREYGQHLFGALAASHPDFLVGCTGAADFLERVDDCVHPEVRKLHPDAELPSFSTLSTPAGLVLHYRSPRPFAALARGLIEGCLAHFGGGEVHGEGGAGDCTFFVEVRREAPCPSAS